MTKQEFMAMSLPYGLKVFCKNPDYTSKTYELYNSSEFCDEFEKTNPDFNYLPVLRPLSDLTKEIEHKGESLIPIVVLSGYQDDFNNPVFGYERKKYYMSIVFGGNYVRFEVPKILNDMNYFIVQKLIEWNFDIAGLIEKGEAIDINTLEENPYK